MKNNIFPIDLIAVTTEKDSINQIVEKTRVTKTVFAEVGSVSQTEFMDGGRIGLTPSLKVKIYDFEYNGEEIVRYAGRLYSVYRTYLVENSDRIELYLETKGGTKNEPNSNDSTS